MLGLHTRSQQHLQLWLCSCTCREGGEIQLGEASSGFQQAISWPRMLSHSSRPFWTILVPWQWAGWRGLDVLMQQSGLTNVLAESKDP